MTIGPFWFSAPKFEVRTFISCVKSAFVFTAWPQLQPGSMTWAPSEVMSSAPVRCPLAEKLPDRSGTRTFVLTRETGFVNQTAGECHAGQNLNEFRSIASDDRDVLQLLLADDFGLFARVNRSDDRGTFNGDGVVGRTNRHRDIAEVPLIARVEGDCLLLPFAKTLSFDGDSVAARR